MRLGRAGWAGLLLEGCTLVGLSRDIEQAPCVDDSDCEVLSSMSDRYRTDTCHPYRCASDHFCAQGGLLDLDGDGFVPELCEPNEARRDCDDTRSDVHPGADERCDRRDQDCDGLTDEGLLTQHSETALDFASPTPIDTLSYARTPDRNLLGLAFVHPSTGLQALQLDIENAATTQPMSVPIPQLFDRTPRARTLAVGDVPSTALALVSYVDDQVPRSLAGLVALPASTLSIAPRIERYGLGCTDDEACSANRRDPEMPLGTPATGQLALATTIDGSLIIQLRDTEPAPPGPCERTPSSPLTPQPVLANWLSHEVLGFSERTQRAVVIGSVGWPQTPALLALPSGSNNLSRGFLLALVDESGALVLYQVGLRNEEITRSDELLRLPAGDRGPWRMPELGLGIRLDDLAGVGLVAVHGCGADARVMFTHLTVPLLANGAVSASLSYPSAELSQTPDQRMPSLAWSRTHSTWGIAYRDAEGTHVRVRYDRFRPPHEAAFWFDGESVGDDASDRLRIVPRSTEAGVFSLFHQVALAPTPDGAPAFSLARSQIDACYR